MASAPNRISLPVLTRAGAPADIQRPLHARVRIVTLGCDKNTVDSERVLGRLTGAGVDIAADGDDADVLVINTCGFIDVAKEESIDAILEAVRLKREGRLRAVVAMGCLVQRYKQELAAEIPEVDAFLGLTEVDRLLPELASRGLAPAAVPTMERPLRALGTAARHTAFLKISEGCDHSCAFCAIPLMRGRFRSTPIEALVREARELEARGAVELNIVSQDTTWYGRDGLADEIGDGGDYFVGRGIGPGTPASNPRARRAALPDLLRALLAGTTIPWLRLFYMYPSGIRPALIELMAAEPRIAPYLDMPIQHGSDAMLERMRRPERRATIRERVRWLRSGIPDIALRTTVIVGFPGETEDDFEMMLELLEEVRFDHLGVFRYSPEEGTRAASMPDPVPDSVARERLERVMDLQRSVSLERGEAWVGRECDVLVERSARQDGELAIGRTARQAPEVDGSVTLRNAGNARAGDLVRARIIAADEADLQAVRVD